MSDAAAAACSMKAAAAAAQKKEAPSRPLFFCRFDISAIVLTLLFRENRIQKTGCMK